MIYCYVGTKSRVIYVLEVFDELGRGGHHGAVRSLRMIGRDAGTGGGSSHG